MCVYVYIYIDTYMCMTILHIENDSVSTTTATTMPATIPKLVEVESCRF